MILGVIFGGLAGYLLGWTLIRQFYNGLDSGAIAVALFTVGAGVTIFAFRRFQNHTYVVFAVTLLTFFATFIFSWYLTYSSNFPVSRVTRNAI
jgi:hypothetical protein